MTPATDPPSKDRYPGLNSFRADEQAIFYGRTREITELLRLVRTEQMVTLFSKSGLGKSSLLSAGLFPLLTEIGMWPIRIRMQQEKTAPDAVGIKSPIAIVTDECRQQVSLAYEKAKIAPSTATSFHTADKARLWEQVKMFSKGAKATPVLVFDQFEEFFSYPLADQKEFASQLAELMHDQAPARVINWLLDLPTDKQTPEAIAWSQQPAIKCVFAIRSDRLAEMHSLKAYIPLILRNRFELGPLTKANAKEAIEKPAQQEQPSGPFNTPDFKYHDDVLNDILAALTERKSQSSDQIEQGDEVEGSQLQIVCQFIESEQKKKFQSIVDTKIIKDQKEVKRILVKFYRTQLAKSGNVTDQAAAANVLENELIEGGRRVGLSKLRMMRLLGSFDDAHKKQIIERLQDARLIRSETTQLGETYEISHDTLIEPIEKSKKIRLAWQQRRQLREDGIRRDKEIQAERERNDLELREQAVKLKEETEAKQAAIKLKDRLVWLSTALVALLILTGVGAFWAWDTSKKNRFFVNGITDLKAAYQYKIGKHYAAYELWNQIDSTDKYLFAPYAGKDVQADTDKHYVGSLYDGGMFEVRQQRNNDRDLIVYRTNAANFNLAGSALSIYQANITKDTTAYSVQFIDLVTQQQLLPNPLPVYNLQAVTQSNDSQYAVVLDSQRHAHLYQLTGESAREIASFDRMLTQDKATLWPLSFRAIFNQSTNYLTVMDASYRIWLYDLRQQVKRLGPIGTKAYRFSGDGSKLAVINKAWELLIYNLTDSSGRADTTQLQPPYKDIAQLAFTPANESALVVTSDPKLLNVVNLTTEQQEKLNAVVVGRSHALIRRDKRVELRDIVRNAVVNCPLPALERSLDMVFYAPDGRTDTHLIALYRDRVEVVDLRIKQKKTIQQKGKPFSRLSLTGNLLKIQLGERGQENQSTAEYLCFFIDTVKNEPTFLAQSVYPKQTENQRDKYGFPK